MTKYFRSFELFITRNTFYFTSMFLQPFQHESGRKEDSWFVEEVTVTDIANKDVYVVQCGKWLSMWKDDLAVKRKFPVKKQEPVVRSKCFETMLSFLLFKFKDNLSKRFKQNLKEKNSRVNIILQFLRVTWFWSLVIIKIWLLLQVLKLLRWPEVTLWADSAGKFSSVLLARSGRPANCGCKMTVMWISSLEWKTSSLLTSMILENSCKWGKHFFIFRFL